MSTTQKRGFRLPWGADRQDDQVAAAEPLLDADGTAGAPDELGAGPFARPHVGDPQGSEDPGGGDEFRDEDHEEVGVDTTNMVDARLAGLPEGAGPAASASDPAPAPEAGADPRPAWPSSDTRARSAAVAPRPAVHVAGAPRRRDNTLVLGLVRAMRQAAQANREEMTERLRAAAGDRIEAIRANGAEEAVQLGKRADEDIVGIREWSKAEMARIKQETEERIEARKVELGRETERHDASVTALVERVEASVSAFEADMERFFEQLLAEEDPARLATLAEQAPEPPDLDAAEPTYDGGMFDEDYGADGGTPDGGTAADVAEHDDELAHVEPEAATAARTADGSDGPDRPDGSDRSDTSLTPEIAAAAEAEAEAEAIEGLHADAGAVNSGDATTTFVVNGLASVPAISAFKSALGGVRGVRSVSVTSGERGTFLFTVAHDALADVAAAVPGMAGFDARVTAVRPNGIDVSVKERAA